MVIDQNRTVHAFSSQFLGEADETSGLAIEYNQWTLAQGWTKPNDILLAPLNGEAWIMDAHLDNAGMIHIVFFGSHNAGADIYYTRAPALDAGSTQSWLVPVAVGEAAQAPKNAALAIAANGQLVLIYGGDLEGNGIYAAHSVDGGTTWTLPVPIYRTYNNALSTFGLQTYVGESGMLHAVWNIVTDEGQGRGIFYTRMNSADRQWSEPIALATADSGLGTSTPTIIEYEGSVIALFNTLLKITMRRSLDGGQTWSDPVAPFSRHVGVNGRLSLVVDGGDNLHLFFGQRIPGGGGVDTHGMWHSTWDGNQWREPRPIVAGEPFEDPVGEKSFDPYDARGVAVQGNVILVTWRTDPGMKGNGVWYSYQLLDMPELPLAPLPTAPPTPTHTPQATPAPPTPTATSEPPLMGAAPGHPPSAFLQNGPARVVVVSVVPVFLILSIVAFRSYLTYQHRR
jgi:hypothetical protein